MIDFVFFVWIATAVGIALLFCKAVMIAIEAHKQFHNTFKKKQIKKRNKNEKSI